MKTDIQKQMFKEVKEKSVFYDAQNYALDYIDEVFERQVFPSEEALYNLSIFE